MERIQGYGWLIVGVLGGAAVALLPEALLQAPNGVAGPPAGWQRAALGLLVFGCFAALYFRAHWIATLAAVRERDRLLAATRARLLEAADEASGSAYIVADNLAPKKARILLMLALTKTDDPVEIQRMMLTY